MSDTKITPADLEAILKLVESAEHLGDFHLKYGDLELRVSRHAPPAERSAHPEASAPPAPPVAPAPPPPRVEEAPPVRKAPSGVPAGMAAVKAPMVGTFYRAPSPGAPAFVDVGDRVQADSVVCIIEVMKLMNSITAGVRGTVRQILVADSQTVEFGQSLVVIEPAA